MFFDWPNPLYFQVDGTFAYLYLLLRFHLVLVLRYRNGDLTEYFLGRRKDTEFKLTFFWFYLKLKVVIMFHSCLYSIFPKDLIITFYHQAYSGMVIKSIYSKNLYSYTAS